MHYEGPIYRPPSESESLLIQATVGCPWNRCTFCMVYKNGPRYRERPVDEIFAELHEAVDQCGTPPHTLFLPAGNTIAMRTDHLAAVCREARRVFPALSRITVYGSSQYIHRKGPEGLAFLAEAGLSRIHVGLESGDDRVLAAVCKGTCAAEQIEAGRWVREAGIELSLYVVLGLGGLEGSRAHARLTAEAINRIGPDYVRLRTFVPKMGTAMLNAVLNGDFAMLGPHGVIRETLELIRRLSIRTRIASDHYTNYVDVAGRLPEDRNGMIQVLTSALARDERTFRPFFIGQE
jgi:radical SAM superfamily enzyme YgiQ (UPF0313 family)